MRTLDDVCLATSREFDRKANAVQWLRSAIIGCVSMLIAFVATLQVVAQGTEGFIPEPISSKQFQHEIKFLDLDWEQRLAAEALHETYKADIKNYREAAMQKFVEETAKLSGGGFSIPTRDQVADILEIREDAITRINSMDRRLFDAMTEVLREEQMQEFARFQRVRERSIHESSFLGEMLNGEGQVNLVNIMREAELSSDALATIEPTMTDYEIAVNIALKNRNETSMEMILKGLDKMAEFDMSKIEEGDQQAMMEAGMAMQSVMMEVMQEAQEAATKVTEVTTRFHRQVMTQLPADAQAAYEEKYLQAAYPKIYAPNPWPEVFIKKALESEDVATADKTNIRNIRDRWTSAHARISKEMKTLTDKNREESADNTMAMMMGGDFDNEFWEKWQELEMERQEAATTAYTSITEIIESQQSEKIGEETRMEQERLQKEWATAQSQQWMGASYVNYGNAKQPGYGSERMDYAVPGPITESEFKTYTKRLNMADDEMIIAQSIFESYQEEFAMMKSEQIWPVFYGDENQTGVMYDQESSPDDLARKRAAARGEALQLIEELDHALFRDLAALCTEDQLKNLEAVQTAREVQRLDADQNAPVWQGYSAELSELVGSMDFSTVAMQSISPTLAEYEKELLPILKKQKKAYDKNELVQSRAQRLQSDFYEKWGDEPDPVAQQEMWEEYSKIYQDGNSEANELNEDRRALEDEWLPELTAALPGNEARMLQKAYNEKRYPTVYPDRDNADKVFDRVVVIRDLTDEQRNKLDAIMMQHNQQHDALSQELIDIERANQGPQPWESDMPDEDQMAEWQRQQMRAAVVRYDRTEMNESTRRAIRAVLTQDQAARVPGLDVERVAAAGE